MNDNEDQRKQDLLDSLLQSLYESDKEHSRSLVSAGMQRIEVDSTKPSSKRLASAAYRIVPRWFSIVAAVAVVAVIAVSMPLFDSTQRATAAVSRSLEQAIRDIGRHYKVTLNVRFPDQREQSFDADLYVKGAQRFAIQTYGPVQRIAPIWLGSNPNNSWVIPPVGPVLEGKRRSLNQWAERREELATPYLHISTALELMRDKYELILLPAESLEINGQTVRCKRVSGRLKGDSTQQAPHQFELWANSETGVALKVVANWNLSDKDFGRESILIQFQEEEDLSDSFFTPQMHGGDARGTIDFSEERQ